MTEYLQFFIFIPLAGFIISLIIPDRQELLLSRVAFMTAGVNLVSFQGFLIYWLWQGSPVLNLKEIVLYRTDHYEFLIDFFFDGIKFFFDILLEK